jgi:hypothetical protein
MAASTGAQLYLVGDELLKHYIIRSRRNKMAEECKIINWTKHAMRKYR